QIITDGPICLFESAVLHLATVPSSPVKRSRTSRKEIPGYDYGSDDDLISVIIGSLLGDCHAESRSGNVRFTFKQSAVVHKSYLYWLHEFFAKRGLCNSLAPDPKPLLNKDTGETYWYLKFSTYTLASFNWIYDMFYVNRIKIVPKNIKKYLTPLAIAIWIMDDGSRANNGGLLLHTNSFSQEDVRYLGDQLADRYGICYSIHVKKGGKGNKSIYYLLYIDNASMDILRPQVKPHMHPDMLYKIAKD
nr:hypothetical protein 246 - Allomyces macrogynus mitochondrion [Allomyces macrogynus]